MPFPSTPYLLRVPPIPSFLITLLILVKDTNHKTSNFLLSSVCCVLQLLAVMIDILTGMQAHPRYLYERYKGPTTNSVQGVS
jgi:hypothetical protein